MPDTLEPVPNLIDDDSVERITRFNEGAIQGLPADLQDQYVSVQSEGIEPSYLLIYAEKEREDALKLHEALADHLVAGGCDWQMRDWHGVPVGEQCEETRRTWLRDARLVLLLLSASLIADLKKGAITLETKRPLLPLALKEVTPDKLQGTALAGRAIFTDQGKAWISRSGAGRDAWVGRAAEQILCRIQTRAPRRDPLDFLALPHLRRADDCDDGHYVTQLLKGQADPEGRPAIDFLLDWLRNPQGDVFCAIFGELGMGKTTLCQRLTRVLLDGRAKDPDLPLPVYLDLRAVNTMGWDWSKGAPELGPMLDHLIGSAYNIPVGQERPGAKQIARLAQEQRGLILFDGLDEAMNRLTPEQCRLFIHRLWSILPPILWKQPPGAPKDWRRPEGVGRLVMTCRSHFFQSLQDQLNALDGQQRDVVTREDYLWVTLLPFSSDQVETYFRQVFSDDPDRAGRVIAMLDQVHDLRELGSRPYNLRLIQDQVEALETIQREGGRVGIADLYEGMVGQWLLRDEKKHRINRDHKLLLMERLALRLWSRQQGDLAYADLNDWLMDQILAEPRWEKIEYRSYLSRDEGPEILKEDLRNATFIVREGHDRFRFAHTSIMEFFLARTLHRALVEERLDDWTIPVPSPETLDFLGGLITGRATGACLAALARIRAAYRAQVSELALAYALRAYDLELPGADFAGFQLQGAALRFQRWQGQKDQAMDWRGADLSGVRLDGGCFIDCDFTGSRFDGADLARTLFDRCRLDRVSARGVDLTGAVVHGCGANSSDFASATLYQSQWLCLRPVGLQGRPPTLFTAARDNPPTGAYPQAVVGHRGEINCLVASPDGRWLVSTGYDGRIRVCDPVSGRFLHCLEDQQDRVRALAVAPNGAWVASAGSDGVVRLWDPVHGRLLHRLEAREGAVLALAVAPDGNWLASATKSSTMYIWEPSNGRLLHRITGHWGKIWALAAAPNGHWLASASNDGRVRIWDPVTGRFLHIFEGHRGGVVSLAVAPNGTWLAAGGRDGTVRFWIPGCGRLLHEAIGHKARVQALLSAPHTRWLATAGEDRKVRIWNIEALRLIVTIESQSGRIWRLAAAPDESWIASTDANGRVAFWNPKNGRFLHGIEECESSAWALAAAPHGRWLAAAGEDGVVRLWDPANGRLMQCLEGHYNRVRALAAGPDGRWLAAAGNDRNVSIWNPASGRQLYLLEGHTNWVQALTAAPDGSWLASAGDDGRVRIWDPESGRLLHLLQGHQGMVQALTAAPDGRWLASAGAYGTINLWNPVTGQLLQQLEGHRGRVWTLAVDPEGAGLRRRAPMDKSGSGRFSPAAERFSARPRLRISPRATGSSGTTLTVLTAAGSVGAATPGAGSAGTPRCRTASIGCTTRWMPSAPGQRRRNHDGHRLC
ncbi:NACHT domain-containing protein [uncultured Thiodictyon sp.]|nr:NACHT domain-containing protein [uncultured Thiodictyon sp.]